MKDGKAYVIDIYNILDIENKKRLIHNKSRANGQLELTNNTANIISMSYDTYKKYIDGYMMANKAIPHLGNPNTKLTSYAIQNQITSFCSYITIIGISSNRDFFWVRTNNNLYPNPTNDTSLFDRTKLDDLLLSRFDIDFLQLANICNNPMNVIAKSTPYSNIYINQLLELKNIARNLAEFRQYFPKTYQYMGEYFKARGYQFTSYCNL